MSRQIRVPFGWFPHAIVRAAVWKALSRTTRLVYYRLCDHAEFDEVSRQWIVRSAITAIANEEAISRDTVSKALVGLERHGLIVRLNEPRRGRMPKFALVTTLVRMRELTSYSVNSDDQLQGGQLTTQTSHMEEPTSTASSMLPSTHVPRAGSTDAMGTGRAGAFAPALVGQRRAQSQGGDESVEAPIDIDTFRNARAREAAGGAS